jgi:type I restriction enzyme R subunit
MPQASPQNSEWLTRKRLIDGRLKRTGWKVVAFDAEVPLTKLDRCAIEEFPTDTGPADYALCVSGQILGIVEAKKLTLGPQNVLSQAERYSKGLAASPLNFRGYRVPFLYSTNGEVIWHHDVRHELNRSRHVAQFHTPAALAEFLRRDQQATCERVLATPNHHPFIRPYQKDANAATEDAIAKRKRHMLLAMATGTGKTFTMVNQTETTWIYDARTNVAGITKKDRILTPEHFKEFEKCFGSDPNGRAKRKISDSKERSLALFFHAGSKGPQF